MKKDNWVIFLAGLLVLCSFLIVIHSGVRDGLITKNTIVLAVKVIGGFIIVFWISILIWFGWAYHTLLNEDKEDKEKEKAKGG